MAKAASAASPLKYKHQELLHSKPVVGRNMQVLLGADGRDSSRLPFESFLWLERPAAFGRHIESKPKLDIPPLWCQAFDAASANTSHISGNPQPYKGVARHVVTVALQHRVGSIYAFTHKPRSRRAFCSPNKTPQKLCLVMSGQLRVCADHATMLLYCGTLPRADL